MGAGKPISLVLNDLLFMSRFVYTLADINLRQGRCYFVHRREMLERTRRCRRNSTTRGSRCRPLLKLSKPYRPSAFPFCLHVFPGFAGLMKAPIRLHSHFVWRQTCVSPHCFDLFQPVGGVAEAFNPSIWRLQIMTGCVPS